MMSAEEIQELGSRPMPPFVLRGLITVQGGQKYLKAAFRVLWMRSEHPDWTIETQLVHEDYAGGFVVAKATVKDAEGRVLATAHSEEKRGQLPFVRKAETGAIARALSLCGYGTQYGELDEEEFADNPHPVAHAAENGRHEQTSGGKAMPINDADGPCADCGAPSGKRHGSRCKLARAA